MWRTILLLQLLTLSINSFPQEFVYEHENNSTVQMSRLRKKGARNDASCTDEGLRKLMHEFLPSDDSDDDEIWSHGSLLSITDHMTESKRAVHRAVIGSFDGSYGVMCAECAFSYILHTSEYCVHTRHNITCLVYKDG